MSTTPERPSAAAMLAEAEAELQAWAAAHPAATLYELDLATERQLARMRAALLGAVVATATTELAPARPACPDCGTPMQRAGRQERTVLLPYDEPLTLTGSRYRCPACGTGLSPLADRLDLGRGTASPWLQRGMSWLGAEVPYTRATALFQHFTGSSLSRATVRRTTVATAEAVQQVVAAQPLPPGLPPVLPMQMSVDGSMVHGAPRNPRRGVEGGAGGQSGSGQSRPAPR